MSVYAHAYAQQPVVLQLALAQLHSPTATEPPGHPLTPSAPPVVVLPSASPPPPPHGRAITHGHGEDLHPGADLQNKQHSVLNTCRYIPPHQPSVHAENQLVTTLHLYTFIHIYTQHIINVSSSIKYHIPS